MMALDLIEEIVLVFADCSLLGHNASWANFCYLGNSVDSVWEQKLGHDFVQPMVETELGLAEADHCSLHESRNFQHFASNRHCLKTLNLNVGWASSVFQIVFLGQIEFQEL